MNADRGIVKSIMLLSKFKEMTYSHLMKRLYPIDAITTKHIVDFLIFQGIVERKDSMLSYLPKSPY